MESLFSHPRRIQELIRLNRYKAYIETLRGESDKAEGTLKNCLEIANGGFERLGPDIKSSHYYVKALILYDKGDIQGAFLNYKNFLKIIKENNFPYKVYFHRKLLFLKIQNALGLYSEQLLNNVKLEKEFLDNSIALNHKAFARLYMEKAKSEMYLSRYAVALKHIEKAVLILKGWHKREKEHRIQGEVYQIKGDIFYRMNKIEQAAEAYRKAWDKYSYVIVDFKSYELIKLFSMWAKCSVLLKNELEYNENIKRLKTYLIDDKTELNKIYEFEIDR